MSSTTIELILGAMTFAHALVVGLGAVVLMHHCRRLEVSLRAACAWALMMVSGVLADQALRGHATVGTALVSALLAAPTVYALATHSRRRA